MCPKLGYQRYEQKKLFVLSYKLKRKKKFKSAVLKICPVRIVYYKDRMWQTKSK